MFKFFKLSDNVSRVSFFTLLYILLLLNPIQIYVFNSNAFRFNFFLLILLQLFLFTTIAIISLLIIKCLPLKKSEFIGKIFSYLSIVCFVNSILLIGSYGVLNGGNLNLDPKSALSITQILFSVLLLLSFFKIKFYSIIQKNNHILFKFCLVYSLAFISYYTLVKRGDWKFKRASLFQSQLYTLSKSKNIIHFVLDELQSDIAINAIKVNQPIKDALDGFIFYNNVSAVFPTTQMSLPMLYSGKIYPNDEKKITFQENVKNYNLGTELESLDYEVDFHTFCNFSPEIRCTSSQGNISSFEEVLKLIDYSLFRSVPDIFKSAIYNNQNWLLQSLLDKDDYLHTDQVGSAHKIFEQFNNSLIVEDINPTYKFFHSLITHSPLWLDENCKPYNNIASPSLENRTKQALCALGHIKKFIQTLKNLNVYNQTMIIISSDHGSNYVEPTLGEQINQKNIPIDHFTHALATLIIKPFNTNGEIKFVDLPVSLLDISSTVRSITNIVTPEEATNILNLKENATRDRYYYGYDWENKYWAEDYFPVIKKYRISGNIRNPSNWYSNLPTKISPLEIKEAINCNVNIPFNSAIDTTNVKLFGFSDPEEWGSWSIGTNSLVQFKPDFDTCNPKYIVVSARAFVPKVDAEVSAEFYINNIYVGKISFRNNEDFKFKKFALEIPQSVSENKTLIRLRFNVTGATSPSNVYSSNDKRVLGLAIESIKVASDNPKK